MIGLGTSAHVFARPHRREALEWCFEVALGCGPVRNVSHPAMPEPMLLVDFPGGGHLSIEFVEEAPDDDIARLGAWLELRADDPAAVFRRALDAGVPEVKHPGHPYYIVVPGGQVFTIVPLA